MFNQLTEPSLRNHLPSLFLTQECWYTPSCPCQNPSLQCLQWHWVLCYPLVIKHGLLEITHFYRLLSLISLSPLNYTYKIMVLTTTYIYVSPFYVSLYIIIYKSPLYVCMYIYITTTVYIYIYIYIYIYWSQFFVDPNRQLRRLIRGRRSWAMTPWCGSWPSQENMFIFRWAMGRKHVDLWWI